MLKHSLLLVFFKYVIWLLTSIPLLSTDSWIFCLKYRSHSFSPSANWLFPLYCSIPSSTLLDFVWGMARVPRFFLPVKTFFSCTSLPICWPSRGHLLCTWYIHTYCCSRACCIPTYTLQGLSLKLQVRAEPHLNLACSACYFYLKNIPVWHCSLFAATEVSRFVQSEIPAALEVFCLCSEILIHILFILNFSVNICYSVKVYFLLSMFNFENYIWGDLFLTTVV